MQTVLPLRYTASHVVSVYAYYSDELNINIIKKAITSKIWIFPTTTIYYVAFFTICYHYFMIKYVERRLFTLLQ